LYLVGLSHSYLRFTDPCSRLGWVPVSLAQDSVFLIVLCSSSATRHEPVSRCKSTAVNRLKFRDFYRASIVRYTLGDSGVISSYHIY